MSGPAQDRIIARTLAHYAAGTSDLAAAERRVSSERYVSAAAYAEEWRTVFRRAPVMLGATADVAAPGDFCLNDRYGLPILVARDGDGTLQAFVNSCTHRGARLVSEPKGCSRYAFRCPYHGWTFTNGGELAQINQEKAFPGVDKGGRKLVRLPVAERHGLIWGGLTPATPLDLAAFLAELEADFLWLDLADHVPYPLVTRRCRANWKVIMEGFVEHYHVPYAHRPEVYSYYDDLLVVDRLGPHQRLVTPRKKLAQLAKVPQARWRLRPVATLAYHVFPNTMLVAHPDHIAWVRIYPIDVTACDVEWVVLVPRATATDAWAPYWERVRAAYVATFEEDAVAGEGIAAAMGSGLAPDPVIGRYEWGILTAQDVLEEWMQAV